MKPTSRWLAVLAITFCLPHRPGAGAAEVGFRMVVAAPTGIEAPDAPEVVIPMPSGSVDVVLDVVLDTALEPCASDPEECAGAENFREEDPLTFEEVFGCSDGEDNDADGFQDLEDSDCLGASGWSLSVATAPCFHVQGVTLSGTVADLETNPPGLRDPEGSFQKTSLVNPDLNDGQEGVVTAVVLSFQRPFFVPPVGTHTVLKLIGRLEATGLAEGELGAPCEVSIPAPDSTGLVGVLEPVRTVVTVRGRSLSPEIQNTVLRARSGGGGGTLFQRGDCNGDASLNLTDGVFLLNYLFLQGPRPPCEAACDSGGDGQLNLTSGVFLLNYLFLQGPSLPAPFPDCGSSAGEPLTCQGPTGCA